MYSLTQYRFYNGHMRHGIEVPECDADQMLHFLNTSRQDADHEPPLWEEWDTVPGTTSSENSDRSESSGSPSDSSDDDDEYRPFLHLPPNPDGKRCRCGSTTHMTINSFACPLNPRNKAADAADNGDDDDAADNGDDDAADNGDDDAADNGNDDDDADNGDDDDGDESDGDDGDESDDNGDDESDDDDAAEDDDDHVDKNDDANDNGESKRPVRRRRRLGLPTRRRRQIVPSNLGAPPSRRRKIERSEVKIDVGANVMSSGTRWKLPATEMFKGKVVTKRMFRGAMRYEVQWEDGVVEYLNRKHISPLLCREMR